MIANSCATLTRLTYEATKLVTAQYRDPQADARLQTEIWDSFLG
jgi:hypothetical protein